MSGQAPPFTSTSLQRGTPGPRSSLISEDLDEILKLSDVVGVLNRGRIVAEFARPVDRHAVGQQMVGHA